MQKFTHTAYTSIVKVRYVYRQTFCSIVFMIFIFKTAEKCFWMHENRLMKIGKQTHQNKLNIWKVVSSIFYSYINALHFMKKKFYYKNLKQQKIIFFSLVCFVQSIHCWISSAFSCAQHRADPAPATNTPLLLQSTANWLQWALIGDWHTCPMHSLAASNVDAASYQTN